MISCGVDSAINSCIEEKTTTITFKGIDSEFESYYNEFSSIYGEDVNYISITFTTIEKHTVGKCLIYSDGMKRIVIDKDSWEEFDDSTREVLVFHELGHCHFGRKHDDSVFSMGDFENIPESIMNTYILEKQWYDQLKNHYQDELVVSEGEI